MWQLAKAMAEMKHKHWTKRWNWSSRTKLALSASWTHGLITRLECLNEVQWSWVQISLRLTFNSYFYIYVKMPNLNVWLQIYMDKKHKIYQNHKYNSSFQKSTYIAHWRKKFRCRYVVENKHSVKSNNEKVPFWFSLTIS